MEKEKETVELYIEKYKTLHFVVGVVGYNIRHVISLDCGIHYHHRHMASYNYIVYVHVHFIYIHQEYYIIYV